MLFRSNQKLAPSANNIKKFHVIVGVGNRVPVAAIPGTGNVQKFGTAANGKSLVSVQTVIGSAHKQMLRFLEILILYDTFLLFAIPEGGEKIRK